MAPLVINTQGTSTVSRPAEEATVQIDVASEGTSQEKVSQDVAETAALLRSIIEDNSSKSSNHGLGGTPPIAKWSSAMLYTSSYIPPPKDSPTPSPRPVRQMAMSRSLRTTEAEFEDPEPEKEEPKRVYTARQSFRVTVKSSHFEWLGPFTTKLSTTPNISIVNIEWTLTQSTRKAIGTECRTEAIKDAVVKARDFATALDVGPVRAVEVNEQSSGYGGGRRMYAMRAASFRNDAEEGKAELALEPEDIDVNCTVDVKFEVAEAR